MKWVGVSARGRTSERSLCKMIWTTPLTETIDSFERLCNGEGDDLPEGAFMYVGSLDDARVKGEKMAAEAAG